MSGVLACCLKTWSVHVLGVADLLAHPIAGALSAPATPALSASVDMASVHYSVDRRLCMEKIACNLKQLMCLEKTDVSVAFTVCMHVDLGECCHAYNICVQI